MESRPPFVEELLKRSLPELTPSHLSDSENPPFSTEVRNKIADLQCHPLLESAVSLFDPTEISLSSAATPSE